MHARGCPRPGAKGLLRACMSEAGGRPRLSDKARPAASTHVCAQTTPPSCHIRVTARGPSCIYCMLTHACMLHADVPADQSSRTRPSASRGQRASPLLPPARQRGQNRRSAPSASSQPPRRRPPAETNRRPLSCSAFVLQCGSCHEGGVNPSLASVPGYSWMGHQARAYKN
eukprot:361082-Chlamydomonas_euryale.AAC.2